jgi:hypothetical protein
VQLFWDMPDSLLIQYATWRGLDPEWGILRLSRGGEIAWELKRTPRLLWVDAGTYYFIDPRADTPDWWALVQPREPER